MRAPLFNNNEFLDETSFNNAYGLVTDSLVDITGNLHTPGLINASALSFSYSGLNVTVNAPLPFHALFSDGTLASANGTTDGESSSSATVDFSSLLPSTGSITAYLVAVSGSIMQEPYQVIGPPQGHPDFSSSFAPYTAYAENQDTIQFQATTTAPDNTNTLFIASTVLSAGQTTITSSSTVGQLYAGAILTQDVSIIGTLEVGDTLTAASAQINGNATITGTASASAGTSGTELINYTQLTNGSIDANFNTLTASSAQINGNATVNGLFTANYDIAGQTLTYNNTGLTVGWNFTDSGGEVDLLLGPQGGSGGLNIYQLNSSGDMVSTTPILALSNTGQLTIQGEALVAAATQNNAAVQRGQINTYLAQNVLLFGADPTGVNDSTTAFQDAINAGNSIYVPTGTYLVSELLTATISSYPGLSIFGDGHSNSILLCSTNGGLSITLTESTAVTVRGISIIQNGSGTTGGNGLSIVSNVQNNGPVVLNDVWIGYNPDGNTNGSFSNNLVLTNISEGFYNGCYFTAASTTTTHVTLQGQSSFPAINNKFVGCFIYNGNIGFLIGNGTLSYVQGVIIDSCVFVDNNGSCVYWINDSSGSLADSLVVSNCLLNGNNNQITTSEVLHVQLLGNYLSAAQTAGDYMLDLNNPNDSIVSGNFFFANGSTTGAGIVVQGTASNGGPLICGNSFYGFNQSYSPITIASSVENCTVRGNSYVACTNQVSNSAAVGTNIILDGGMQPPAQNSTSSTSATSLTATTSTFTAPCNGWLMCYGYGQSSTSGTSGSGLSASLSGLVVNGNNATDYGIYGTGYLPMTAGQQTTVSFNATAGTAGALDAFVSAFFIPNP